MTRSPRRKLILYAAVAFGIAPIGFGLMRAFGGSADSRPLWMAAVSSVFMLGVLATAVGRRRGRRAVAMDAAVIFAVAILSATFTGWALGATIGPSLWMLAAIQAACLAVSSVFVALERPKPT